MSKQLSFVSLEDLIRELTALGQTQREAALQIKRELENADILILDPHLNPWSADKVLKWAAQILQSLANWKPGARPPSMLIGTADYLSHLRYYRPKMEGSARAGAGRPQQYDWGDAEAYAIEFLKKRGDPTDSLNHAPGWRSKSDLAKAVHAYLEKLAARNGEQVPEPNTVRNKVPVWLEKFRALN